MQREWAAVEVLTVLGWYRGRVTLPAGGRLLDFLNSKPSHIALTAVRDPEGRPHPFLAINTDQVLAIRDATRE